MQDETTSSTARAPKLPASSRYRVLATLARDASATSYVGALSGPHGFERRVAVTRARGAPREPGARPWLGQWTQVAAHVDHPHVLGVRDVEDVDGELLVVTDYVEGVSLAELCGHGRLPKLVAGRILLDVALGLAALHGAATAADAGLAAHADVSPENILVGLDGSARISELGARRSARPPGASDAPPAPDAWTSARGPSPHEDVLALARLGRQLLEPAIAPPVVAALYGALEAATTVAFVERLETSLREAGLVGARAEVEALVLARSGPRILARRRRANAAAVLARLVPHVTVERGTPFARLLAEAFAGSRVLSALAVLGVALATFDARVGSPFRARGVLLRHAAVRVGLVQDVVSTRDVLRGAATATDALRSIPSEAPSPSRLPGARAVAAARCDSERLSERAASLWVAHDLLRAEATYAEARACNPQYLPARLALADLAWEAGRKAAAHAEYHLLVERYPAQLLPPRVAERSTP
jgi:hypothetical protein